MNQFLLLNHSATYRNQKFTMRFIHPYLEKLLSKDLLMLVFTRNGNLVMQKHLTRKAREQLAYWTNHAMVR